MKRILVIGIITFHAVMLFSQNLGLATVEKGRSKAVSSHAPTDGSNADIISSIKPGETTDIANIKGFMNYIWLAFNEARPNWLNPKGR